MLTNQQFDQFKKELNTLINLYKKEYSDQKTTNWKTYEKQWTQRIKTAQDELTKTIHQAAQKIKTNPKPFGRPPTTNAEQKALILLQKDLAQFSNRKMAALLPMFSSLNKVETSYKTIERAYSNPIVKMIIHNMFIIMVKKKKIRRADLTGDGTGYSLTITTHYRTVRGKTRKPSHGGLEAVVRQEKWKLFTYAFALMDLKSHLYVGYGASLKSEKAAFEAALNVMRECGVEPKSIRLDQYYAGQSTAVLFGGKTSLFVIPKRNATIQGSYVWKDMLRDFMFYPFLFLAQYFRREHSESGFSADKRCDGWKIWQRKEERILTATMLKGVWHNLLWLGG